VAGLSCRPEIQTSYLVRLRARNQLWAPSSVFSLALSPLAQPPQLPANELVAKAATAKNERVKVNSAFIVNKTRTGLSVDAPHARQPKKQRGGLRPPLLNRVFGVLALHAFLGLVLGFFATDRAGAAAATRGEAGGSKGESHRDGESESKQCFHNTETDSRLYARRQQFPWFGRLPTIDNPLAAPMLAGCGLFSPLCPWRCSP
jgi:hypothetical protein